LPVNGSKGSCAPRDLTAVKLRALNLTSSRLTSDVGGCEAQEVGEARIGAETKQLFGNDNLPTEVGEELDNHILFAQGSLINCLL
jgi:hypothetical protein